MSWVDGVSECWRLSATCVLEWDAVAAIATAATLVAGGGVFVADKMARWRAARLRKRVIASGLLHPLQLTINFIRAAKPLLETPEKYANDPRGFGEALLGHEGVHVAKYADAVTEFVEEVACDIAYAMSLVVSIDGWARWLTQQKPDGALVESMKESASFHVEAANQILESLSGVEEVLKSAVPKRIMERRFGPKPTDV